jgi:fluoride exporter
MLWHWVALGSALGSGARFAVHDLSVRIGILGFPWDTLFVNVSGSLLIGLSAAVTVPGGRLPLSATMRQFVMTGFCGGYTTFSLFSLESLMLLERAPWLGAVNLGVTALACLVAVWCGYRLGTQRRPGERTAPAQGRRRI